MLRPLKQVSIVTIVSLLLTSCISYHSKPIDPAETAAAFEARTLDSPDLRGFMEENLHRKITSWPPETWDFSSLLLAALYYHSDLDVARANWVLARAGIITAGERPNPGLTFAPQFDANPAKGVSPWTLGLGLDIPIETSGKRGYRIAQAEELSKAARLSLAGTAWKVRSRFKTRFLARYASCETEEVLQQQLAVQEKIVGVLEKRLGVGEISQIELTQAHLSLDQTRLALLDTQRQTAESRIELADSIGLTAQALDGIDICFGIFEQDLPGVDLLPPNLQREALLNRADILELLAEYDAAQAGLQMEIAKQYPDLQLGPGYSWDQGENKWSIGFSISLPLFNRNEGPIAEAEARRKAVTARFMALQAQVIGEIDRALAGYRMEVKKMEAAKSLEAASAKALQSAQALYSAGEADHFHLLQAKQQFLAVRLTHLAAFIKAWQALGLLEDAGQRPFEVQQSPTPPTDHTVRNENRK